MAREMKPQRPAVAKKPKKQQIAHRKTQNENQNDFESQLNAARELCAENLKRYEKIKAHQREARRRPPKPFVSPPVAEKLDDLASVSSMELDAIHAEILKSADALDDKTDGLDGLTIDEAFNQIQQTVASGSGCQVVKSIRRYTNPDRY